MAARSLNKVLLIGNLTRDPELRYTPQGTAVCSFGLATNRGWTTDAGEKREEAEFHRIVAWNKLAELCSQLLTKGRKVYVEGRLQTRTWQAQDGTQRTTTEVVIEDMILLDSRRVLGEAPTVGEGVTPVAAPAEAKGVASQSPVVAPTIDDSKKKKKAKTEEETGGEKPPETEEEINPDDIPF
jgi:single-strand DNA-binding protein